MTRSRSRIALFLPSLAGGGAERVFLDLARGLTADDRDVDLVLAQAEGELLGQTPVGVRVVDLGTRRTATAVGRLASYISRERPAVTLSALYHANIVAVAAHSAARHGGRVAVTEHLPPRTWLPQTSRLARAVTPRLMRVAYRRADAVIAVSGGVADDLAVAARIPRRSISVIYNPVDVDLLRLRASEPIEDPWHGSDRAPLVLAVGRLTAQKDFPTLIRAFARVRQQRACRLLILGEGEQRTELEALVSRLGLERDVKLPGFRKNPYPYFRQAAVFVLSSRWEGLPTVLIEAVCLGTPVVATDCHSGPREILDNGRYGTLVRVGDSIRLSHAIAESLAGQASSPPESLVERYRTDRVVAQYERVVGIRPTGIAI